MEKVQTLEESYYDVRREIEKIINSNCQDIPYEGTEVDKSTMTNEILNFLFENRVKFAKFHVQAALKAAHKNAKITSTGHPEYKRMVTRYSIINAYPLENIK